eukprot:TRINITY_DN80254_c0_g1_i1.p1 TRINITY_DN80254_c0_g1~~TRINITY_DN80254_c0_g1_i1.p1  ORF type:complete len:310 (-),score=54.07 TRINITY_DN80254_c0_g1_i1:661-1590(-)
MSSSGVPAMDSLSKQFYHDVWDSNFEEEFATLLEVVTLNCGSGVTLALDMEFPGFLLEHPRVGSREARYNVLRQNVDRLWPIQIGVAVASASGEVHGVWTFNLQYDADNDAGNAQSLAFLRCAGIDFRRHRAEGLAAKRLGSCLAASDLVRWHGLTWLTFSGTYDFGYLLKLLTAGKPLPTVSGAFQTALATFCPKRKDLRDLLPPGSLDALAKRHGVLRQGRAHTAGSDALLTLELFLLVAEKAVSTKQDRWSHAAVTEWNYVPDNSWESWSAANVAPVDPWTAAVAAHQLAWYAGAARWAAWHGLAG